MGVMQVLGALAATFVAAAPSAARSIEPARVRVPSLGPPSELGRQSGSVSDKAGDEIPFELRVNRAIARAVGYLRTLQQKDGGFAGWEGEHPGGATALAALALAKAGVRPSDESLQRALTALSGVRFQSTYSAAVHLILCDALPDGLRPPERRAAAEASLAFLVENQRQGVWAYPWGHLCGSNTQFALMGLRSARRLGLEVPRGTWLAAANGLFHFQDRSGGFEYEEGGRPYAGMTAAALAGLAVLDEVALKDQELRALLRKHKGDREAAEAWLAQRFDVSRNAYANGSWTPFWHAAYMWAVERWCGLSQRTEFAGRDWYREGARFLLDTQAVDGSWTSDDKPFPNTCLALLFLRRATVSPQGELKEIYEEIDRQHDAAQSRHERPGPQALRITSWWLAGPWQGKPDGALLLEPPFDPARPGRPKARAKLASSTWRAVELDGAGWSNLEVVGERAGDWSLWCALTELRVEPVASGEADAGALEALLWLDLEDGWDVWLDGVRLSRERRVGAAINGDVCVPLRLEVGAHTLCVLVEDVFGAAAFGARLSSVDNGPPPERLRAGFASARR